MIINHNRLKQIIREEIEYSSDLNESAVDSVVSILGRIGQLKTASSAQGMPWVEAALEAANLGWDEYRDNIASARLGLSALEGGLIGLAIGVPMLFFEEYTNSKKGDEVAKWLAAHHGRPIETKDIIDPRDSSNHKKIAREGGDLKSNPILYLASQKNLNAALNLMKDDAVVYKFGPNKGKKGPAIGPDVYGIILDIYKKARVARKHIKQILADESVYSKIDKALDFIA